MSDPRRLVGTYLLGLEPMLISIVDDEVRLRLSGVPEDLAARLVGAANSFVVEGSQFEGATIEFASGDPAPGGAIGGVIDFVRSEDVVYSATGWGLRLDDAAWDPPEEQAYRHLSDHIIKHRDGFSIEWSLPWPKWRFVEWLSRRDDFIFHGSPIGRRSGRRVGRVRDHAKETDAPCRAHSFNQWGGDGSHGLEGA